MGWDLFENYLIAKEKFKPDYFLYENNKSAAQAIKDEIKKRLNVWDGSFLTEDSGARYIEINSALVSAQNRQRFYVHNCGDVEQPEDRGILLKDILESNGNRIPKYAKDKSRPLTATYKNKGSGEGSLASECFPDNPNKQVFDYIAEPVACKCRGRVDSQAMDMQNTNVEQTEKGNALDTNTVNGSMVAEPVPNFEYIDYTPRKGSEIRINENAIRCNQIKNNASCAESFVEFTDKKAQTVTTAHTTKIIDNAEKYNSKLVYEVRNGLITIKGKQYPIKLKDGYYIIRKLTVTECCRLQTLPDDYCRAVSASQGYKGCGNGWTAEVIIHILSHALKDIPKDEKIVVLSMYDGIGTGRYCLDKMGFTNVEYHAYEIDKYAMQIAMSNYPDIIQHGDAFAVRNEDWKL